MSDIYIQVKKGGGGGLPVTGQTTSYRPGDDGDIQAGIPNAGRFIDNGDGTITDTATNLMWRKWAYGRNQSTGAGGSSPIDWNAAIDLMGDSHAGYSDWRLPNFLELLSIMNFQNSLNNNMFYNSVFPPEDRDFWSSTTAANNNNYAFCVGYRYVGTGGTSPLILISKSIARGVRLVRPIT